MSTADNIDIKGVPRGACYNETSGNKACSCTSFKTSSAGSKCATCQHYPVDHENLALTAQRGQGQINGVPPGYYPPTLPPGYCAPGQPPMMYYPPMQGVTWGPGMAPGWPGGPRPQFVPMGMTMASMPPQSEDSNELAQRIRKVSTRVTRRGGKSKFDIYQPRTTNEYEHEFPLAQNVQGRIGGIRKLNVGNPKKTPVTDVVILIVGATGCGKTTFLNGLANYLFGVKRTDNFRFKIVAPEDEMEEGDSSTTSKTRWVSAYTFHDTIHENHRLIMVDTPGFGDTGGIERDKETTKFIGEWFKKTGETGLDHLNAICFVVKNSETRLTHQTIYQIGAVTRLFGSDMRDIVIPIITFCDGGKPPALQALTEQKVEYKKYFPFNNSGIFPTGDEDNFEELFWKLGMKSYQDFCTFIFTVHPVSLTLSKEVLKKRQQLEVHVMDLKKKVDEEILMLETMKQHVEIIRRYESEIESNRNFKITINVPKIIKVDVPNEQYTTNCIVCSYTCHEICQIPDDDEKAGCAAIDQSTGNCMNCPRKCHWRQHKNMRFVFKTTNVDEETTLDELKKKYSAASDGKTTTESLLKNLAEKFMSSQEAIRGLLSQIREAINDLKEIAMSSDKLTEVDYIKLLIQSENEQKSPGYVERVEHLTVQLQMAELMASIDDPKFDPFAKYKADPQGWTQYLMEKYPKMWVLINDVGATSRGKRASQARTATSAPIQQAMPHNPHSYPQLYSYPPPQFVPYPPYGAPPPQQPAPDPAPKPKKKGFFSRK